MSHSPKFGISSHLARLLALAALTTLALVETPSSGRSPVARLDALPGLSERLTQPVWLPHCGMRVVEWRPTSSMLPETSVGPSALAVLDETCRSAFDRYTEFLRAKGLPHLRNRPETLPSISLLPGNILLDGKSLRALNDLPSRFEAVAPGCCYWGLYVDSLNHLFLRNDPLIRGESGALEPNPRFVRTLTHEISHVLSSRMGVWDIVGYDRQRDEDLAEQFVEFMGMRFPAESSAEDLAFHRGRVPYTPASGAVARAESAPVNRAAPLVAPPAPSASANTSEQGLGPRSR
jgi:hypothetical protein